jgi:hypothetical protein
MAAIKTVFVRGGHAFFTDREITTVLDRLAGLQTIIYHNKSCVISSPLVRIHAAIRRLRVATSSRIYTIEDMLLDEYNWRNLEHGSEDSEGEYETGGSEKEDNGY